MKHLNKKQEMTLKYQHFFIFRILFLLITLFQFTKLVAQEGNSGQTAGYNLDACLRYAFKNQPRVKQLLIDEKIARQDVNVALSDWLPQINSTATLEHYLKQPVMIFPDFANPSGEKIKVTTGVEYSSPIEFSASQVIFNNSVYIAGKSSKYYNLRARQITKESLVDLVLDISKTYYSVLLARQQVKIYDEDIDRLNKSLKDAYAQYQNGTTDKIDYKRATISLNESMARKVAANELIGARLSALKDLIGYPVDSVITLAYDSASLEQDILVDTLTAPVYQNRIEYQLLQTNLVLLKSNMQYYKLSYLPSLSGFANYNLVFQNDSFNELYKESFPNSSLGLTLSFPILEGNKRSFELKRAKLQYESAALDTINLKQQISSDYTRAMATYRSSLYAYRLSVENIEIAQDVYNTVDLQYEQGIKAYLEVIVAEADLRSAQINSLNALFVLMSSKLDVEKALGKISTNY
jgi:outer membrane protein